jgi:hypothetical protein
MHIITNMMIVDAMLQAVRDGRLANCDKTVALWSELDAKYVSRYVDPVTEFRCAIGAALPPTAADKIAADDDWNGTIAWNVPWDEFGVEFEDLNFAAEIQHIHDISSTPSNWDTRDLRSLSERLIGKPAVDHRIRLGRHTKTAAWWAEFLGLVKQHLETPV